MTRKGDFADYVVELLSSSGPVSARRMFGGHGIYRDGLMFALIAGDVLYLKCDDETRPRFDAAGSEPFIYEAKNRRMATSYWRMPDEAMESPALASPWARLAFDAALRKAGTAAKRKPAIPPAKKRKRAAVKAGAKSKPK